ncbi:MAG: beta-ketoacyl-[acyl-carrier-protein] synthase family protein [Polyangiaceae bacterium]
MSPGATRVAVTGVGIVTALGSDASSCLRALLAGQRGIRQIRAFDVTGHRCRIGAEVDTFAHADADSRCQALARQAAREALATAGVDASMPMGVALGVTTGSMPEAEALLAARPNLDEDTRRRLISFPLSHVTAGVTDAPVGPGPRATIASACSSSAASLALGANWVATGEAERVLAGGADVLCRLTFAGFDALGALDPSPARAFDVSRAGLNLGEGAAFLVLESEAVARERGAPILGFLAGWALGAEAFHVTQPDPTATSAAHIVEQALERARIAPRDLDLVNAHGTATVHNDLAEGVALQRALGAEARRVPVTSSKPQVGHTLGACGAIEAALTLLCMQAGQLPPCVGLTEPDPAIPLTFCGPSSRPQRIRAALSTSFGFGGAGAALVFTAPGDTPLAVGRVRRRVFVHAAASVLADGLRVNEEHALLNAAVRPAPDLPAGRSRRFDSASRLTAGAVQALRQARETPPPLGLICANAYGTVSRSVTFLQRLFERGRRAVPPAEFPQLVPGAMVGNASIYNALHGPALSCSDRAAGAEQALSLALSWIAGGNVDWLCAGAVEGFDAFLGAEPSSGSAAPGTAAALLLLGSESTQAIAELTAALCGAVGSALPLPHPAAPARARVFSEVAEAHLVAALGSAWSEVPRVRCPVQVSPEGVSAVLTCMAAGIIARGDIDEALIVAEGERVMRVTHLQRPIAS